eukprot:7343475-Pyramimonas_sp.AAC.1
MPPSGVATSLCSASEGFFTRACNFYRQSLPNEYANHPFFASAMKVDQTFGRFAAVRMRRREAFLKTLFGESWVMVDQTHPVDMPMAEASLRCDLAMRFAVYNELQCKLARDKASLTSSKGGEDGEEVEDIASGGKPTPGQQSPLEKALRKLLNVAQQSTENVVEYDCDAFKKYPSYKGTA